MIDPTQLDWKLPSGVALADATGAEIRQVSAWLAAVADQLRPEESPSSWMNGAAPHGRAEWRPTPQPPIMTAGVERD